MNRSKKQTQSWPQVRLQRFLGWLFLGGFILLLSSCADTVTLKEAANREPVGFWYGLWHGFILLISFIVSLFDPDVAIYATYNNGGWYDFGFLLGASFSIGGGSRAGKSQ
jgi:hypothetical protein